MQHDISFRINSCYCNKVFDILNPYGFYSQRKYRYNYKASLIVIQKQFYTFAMKLITRQKARFILNSPNSLPPFI